MAAAAEPEVALVARRQGGLLCEDRGNQQRTEQASHCFDAR